MSMIPHSVEELIAVGLLPYPVKSIEPHGEGMINHTYKITTSRDEDPNFLLQKINSRVFKDVDQLQKNIKLITDHIRQKIEKEGVEHIENHVLTPSTILSNGNARSYYWDHNNDYWRLYHFVEESITYERPKDLKMAYKAGEALAIFHKQLSDFKSPGFKELLPNFHNTPKRVDTLKRRIKKDSHNRVKGVEAEIEFLLSREKEYSKVKIMGEMGIIPTRVIHQDPKINNLLFNKKGDVICVIDLDTVMHGHLCYDVGDAIRYCANKGKEDEKDLANIEVDMEIFKHYMNGYTSIAKDFISWAEMESLGFGPRLMTYEQAVRFLSDYLSGDIYYAYKSTYPTHNLDRARAQIRLLEKFEECYNDMSDHIRSLGNWDL